MDLDDLSVADSQYADQEAAQGDVRDNFTA